MTYNDFDYVWDDRMFNGMGGWRVTEHTDEPKPERTADDFRDALIKKMS